MGFGDPCHKHPLREVRRSDTPENDDLRVANCFHCELPITEFSCYGFTEFSCYGCTACDYYIHKLCQDLPITIKHPLHDQHPLTRIEPPSSSNSPNICNQCQNPCLGRFAFHCPTCQLFFHLKCLFTLNHEKHGHPLILSQKINEIEPFNCNICGFLVWGLFFGCMDCDFYIHPECSLIPVMVERHHYHELTLRHNFPQECDQVYCDLCEDKDGELDCTLSYYYCKRCDYIAHVHCCIAQLREDFVLYESFTHEHHLTRASKICCNQCDYVAEFWSSEYPSLIKHPIHPEHTLVVDREGEDALNCTECQFTVDNFKAFTFTHPLWRYDLKFYCGNRLFRCDACGELGKGSRMRYERWSTPGEFDLHLECFALPGKLKLESHPHHPLYLRWLHNISKSRYCSVCTKEMDPQLWFYFCQECDYAAHMDCVARDLLSTLRSSIKNQPDFCGIIEPDKTLFEYQNADSRPPQSRPSYRDIRPMLKVLDDDGGGEAKCDFGIESDDDVLRCPKCYIPICTEARYSSINDWQSSHCKNSSNYSMTCDNDQIPLESEPLSFLDEQIIDELCCSICDVLIFPPTYSCAPCQIFFHKSCAELPRKILFNETTYFLKPVPFPEGLSCTPCGRSISSFAYFSSVGGIVIDVSCASETPPLKKIYHIHELYFTRPKLIPAKCFACSTVIKVGTVMIYCKRHANFPCPIFLHQECGLLPLVIKHRIHQHPLELATDLSVLDDEYICDVCEKDLNPNLWAYRCVDSCGIKATSHVTCVITSKKKCHFRYEDECQNMTEDQMLAFRQTEAGIQKYGKRTGSF